MPRSLFRKEAIDAQRQKFLGEASVAQPPRLWMYTATALAVAVIVIAYSIWGQYTRRERVQGYLVSAVGAAVVKMPDAGTVTELMVNEGDHVEQGASLARVTVDRSGVNSVAGDESVRKTLEARKKLLVDEQVQAGQLGRQLVEQAQKRVASLQEEIKQAETETKLQSDRLASAQKLLAKWKELQSRGFANDYYILQYEKEVQDQEVKVQTIRRQRAALEKDLTAARSEVPSTVLRAQAQVEQLTRAEGEVDQRIAELANLREQTDRRVIQINAPIGGTVTNIGPSRGQTVEANAPLATILPTDSALHAELLVPTRAIGFVKPGQRVWMRYEAFPYERFGQYGGTVESVGKDVLTRNEVAGPLTIRDPMMYRIVVKLDRQDIDANGQALPLRAGMVLGADLLMEKRSLIEWIFGPAIGFATRTGMIR